MGVFDSPPAVSFHEYGLDATDSINSNDATLVNGATASSGLQLDGINDFARVANEGNFDVDRNDAWGASFAFTPDSTGGSGQYIFSKFDSVGYLLLYDTTNERLQFREFNGGGSNLLWVYSAVSSLPKDVEAHFAFTVDGSRAASGVKMYINKVRKATVIAADTLNDSSMLNNKQIVHGIFSNEVASPLKGSMSHVYFRHGSVMSDGGVAVGVTATGDIAELYGGGPGAYGTPGGVGALVNGGLVNRGLVNGGLVG